MASGTFIIFHPTVTNLSSLKMSGQEETFYVNGKPVMAADNDVAPPLSANTLPQRERQVQQQFDNGEFKPVLTEATETAVRSQQQGQGVTDPIKNAALIGPGSFTGFENSGDNVALMQKDATQHMARVTGTFLLCCWHIALTQSKSEFKASNQERYR
jgi:hypothetical protein